MAKATPTKKKATKKKVRVYGTGTVHEIKPGKWLMRYTPKGAERLNKSVDATNQREALDKLAAWRKELDAETNPGVKVPCSFLFGLHIQDMRRYGKSAKDIKTQEQKIKKHLMEFFGRREAKTVALVDILEYIDIRLQETRMVGGVPRAPKPSTINRMLAALRRSFQLGFEQKYISAPLPKYVELSEKKNVRQGFIDLDAYRHVANCLPPYLRLLWCFGFFFGIRTGELLSFRWEWLIPYLNEPEPVLKVPGEFCKNGEPHSIPIYHPEMKALIEFELTTRDPSCPYLFQHHFATGTRRIKSFRKAFDTAKAEAGFPFLIFHDLRRSAIRLMMQAGIGEKRARQISGHKTRSVFDRYDVVNEKDVIETGQIMRKFFATKAEIEAEELVAATRKANIGNKSGNGEFDELSRSVSANIPKRLN